MKTNFIGVLKIVFKFGFAFAILGYMVYSGRLDLHVVKSGFANVPLLLACIFFLVISLVATLYRWGLLMRGQGIEFSPRQLVRYGMIGAFFNTTMPGAVSGDLIKAWYVLGDHKGKKKTPVLTSILLDRVMGVFGLVLVASSPLLLFWGRVWEVPQLQHVASIVLALFAAVLLFFLYIMLSVWGPLASLRRRMDGLGKNRVGAIALQAYDAWLSYRERPAILVKALLLAVSTHLLVVTVIILCSRALGDNSIAYFQYFLLVPIGLLTTAIPVAPAGLGVGHVAFAALFGLAGSKNGAEVFTMFVTLQILLNLTGIFFYLSGPKAQPQAGA